MKAAGYDAKIQTYKFTYTSFVGTPTFSEITPTSQTTPSSTIGSRATATAWRPTPRCSPPAASCCRRRKPVLGERCSPDDFTGFIAGKIALIQRGTCNFGVKVLNAEAAGASGVVIFNEGNPGRTGVASGSMVDADNNPFVPTIPVAFTSFAIGNRALDEYNRRGTPPRLEPRRARRRRPEPDDWNVIAESKRGDPNHVVVVDAHLDAIFGAGMLDNASGSATILDIAQKMKKVHPRNKLRFIWFGGEELGLLGSDYYVNNLTPTELGKISYDLDADVTATPNYLDRRARSRGVGPVRPRPSATTFPPQVYEPSKIARDMGVDYFDSMGKNHEFLSPVGTDAFMFNTAGVPASGVLTGQDCCKTQEEVDLFGGQLGNFEGNLGTSDGGCVDNPFRWCDNRRQQRPEGPDIHVKAFANMVVQMAFDTTVVGVRSMPIFSRSALKAAAAADRSGRNAGRGSA